MKKLLENLRGVLVFAGLTLNTIVWFVPLMVLAVVKLLVPIAALRQTITRWLMWIGENWVAVNTAWLGFAAHVDWQGRGIESLPRNGWYLVVANHQTWVDIVVLQALFNRRVPFLKFFIKQQLIWFPLLGLAWWALDMPFMKRYSASYLARNPEKKGRDLETTRKACEKFRHTPTSILNFIEGTRFSEAKRMRRQSPYRNLLQPRAGGFAVALDAMGELFTGIVDATLVYPDGAVSFWEMCCGRPARCHVEARVLPLEKWMLEGDYQEDREFRRRLHAWLAAAWTEKDAQIDKLRREAAG